MKIGLALSGGGAKGAAHIGVLQALKEEDIKIDYISGTSSGSIIAALYAVGYNPFHILSIFNTYCKHIADYDKMLPFKLMNTIFTGKISICGLAKGDKLESIINMYMKNKGIIDISQVPMPLAIPTVDLKTGEVIYFISKGERIENTDDTINATKFDDDPTYLYSGYLCSIIRASSSFPAVFQPKIYNKKVLVDGGVRVNTPVSILKQMGAEKVIAVSFDRNKYVPNNFNIVSVSIKSFDIMGHQVNQEELSYADYVLRPKLDDVSLLDGSKTNLLATQGYQAVKREIESIKEKIQS